MKRLVIASLILFAPVFCGNTANAATVYDGTLSAPGFFSGTGGSSNGFAVTTNNGIEVAMSAILRQNGADIANSANNVYYVPLGAQTNVTSGGNGANAGRAAWNLNFSVLTQPGNNTAASNGGLLLSDIYAQLTYVTVGGGTVSIPLTTFSDNDGWGPSGKNVAATNAGIDWGVQNSENALFLGLNMNLNATHNFNLNVYSGNSINGRLLASSDIVVVVGDGGQPGGASPTPLPASVWGGGSLIAGLGIFYGIKRRRVVLA